VILLKDITVKTIFFEHDIFSDPIKTVAAIIPKEKDTFSIFFPNGSYDTDCIFDKHRKVWKGKP